jgi:NAD(P)-dependent dehydrogenase (short-subunit alcohol dehydrogenase family)
MNTDKKTALITGANAGIGLELTKRLLLEDWEILALVRSDFNMDDTLIVHALEKNKIRIYKADLADFHSLKNAINQIQNSETHIDLLFNNAGVSLAQYKYAKQGRELHFEVNTLVPFIILMELKELLTLGKMRTIINTSSNSLLFLKKFDLDHVMQPTKPFKKVIGSYAHSKLALSLWTKAIAHTLALEGIKIRSVCPGPSTTRLTEGKRLPAIMVPFRSFIFNHPCKGAVQLYNAAFHFSGQTGIFINKGKSARIKLSNHEETVLAEMMNIYTKEYLGSL